MKYILVLNGPKESGKDTFIDILSEISSIPIIRYSSIDYIKNVAIRSFDWDGIKDAKGRKLLSDLKDAATAYNNLPFKRITEFVEDISIVQEEFIFCTCVREPPEIKKLLDFYNKEGYTALSVCITRDSKTGLEESNHADEGVFDFTYDVYLDNNSTIDGFKGNIEVFYENLLQ